MTLKEIRQVTDDSVPVEITSQRGSAVLMSLEDYASLQQAAHLRRVPANACRLIESLTQAQAGLREHGLVH